MQNNFFIKIDIKVGKLTTKINEITKKIFKPLGIFNQLVIYFFICIEPHRQVKKHMHKK